MTCAPGAALGATLAGSAASTGPGAAYAADQEAQAAVAKGRDAIDSGDSADKAEMHDLLAQLRARAS